MKESQESINIDDVDIENLETNMNPFQSHIPMKLSWEDITYTVRVKHTAAEMKELKGEHKHYDKYILNH